MLAAPPPADPGPPGSKRDCCRPWLYQWCPLVARRGERQAATSTKAVIPRDSIYIYITTLCQERSITINYIQLIYTI